MLIRNAHLLIARPGLWLVLPLLTACSTMEPTLQEGMPVEQAANLGRGTTYKVKILDEKAQGPIPLYRKPIISETKVMAAYVPEHVDPELKLKRGAQWVWFILEEADFVVDGQEPKDDEPHPPLSPEVASKPDFTSLRKALASREWIIPYRSNDEPPKEKAREREEEQGREPRD